MLVCQLVGPCHTACPPSPHFPRVQEHSFTAGFTEPLFLSPPQPGLCGRGAAVWHVVQQVCSKHTQVHACHPSYYVLPPPLPPPPGSLGLISDAFHMVFDCTALLAGLVAVVITRWGPNERYTFGYVLCHCSASRVVHQPCGPPAMWPTSRVVHQPCGPPAVWPTSRVVHQPCGPPAVWPTGCVVHQPCGPPAVWPTSHVAHQLCGPPAVWSTSRVVRQPCGPPAVWSTSSVVHQPCGPPAVWSTSRVVHQPCGPPAVWPTSRVVHQPCGPPAVWPTSRVVHQPCGPPAVWSTSRVVRQPCGPPAVWSTSSVARQPCGPPAVWSTSRVARQQCGPHSLSQVSCIVTLLFSPTATQLRQGRSHCWFCECLVSIICGLLHLCRSGGGVCEPNWLLVDRSTRPPVLLSTPLPPLPSPPPPPFPSPPSPLPCCPPSESLRASRGEPRPTDADLHSWVLSESCWYLHLPSRRRWSSSPWSQSPWTPTSPYQPHAQ